MLPSTTPDPEVDRNVARVIHALEQAPVAVEEKLVFVHWLNMAAAQAACLGLRRVLREKLYKDIRVPAIAPRQSRCSRGLQHESGRNLLHSAPD